MTSDLAAGLAALLTAVVAVIGINAWRRRLRGTTEYRAALHVLEGLSEVLEAIEQVRTRHTSPADLTAEKLAPDGPAPSAETEAEVLSEARTYREKLVHVGEAREHLQRSLKVAHALWGGPATDALADINAAIQTLYATAEHYFESEVDRARRIERDDGHEGRDAETQAMKRVLYAMPDAKGKDPFGERIQRATAAAEGFYREYLL